MVKSFFYELQNLCLVIPAKARIQNATPHHFAEEKWCGVSRIAESVGGFTPSPPYCTAKRAYTRSHRRKRRE